MDKNSIEQLKRTAAGREVIVQGVTEYERTCSSCGGLGVVYYAVLGDAALSFPPDGVSVVHIDGHFRIIEESLGLPCGACTDAAAYYQRKKNSLWEQSGLLRNEQTWVIDYIDGLEGKTIALRVARGLLAAVPRPVGLGILLGDYGVGKTGLLKALVAQFIHLGIPAKYITGNGLLSEVKNTYENGNGSELDLFDSYERVAFLAIDEVDVIGSSAWAESTLRTIFDRRYAGRRECCTMFASNAALVDLWGYLRSRLEDGLVITIGGSSLRGAHNENR